VALPIGLGEPLVDLGAVEADLVDEDPDAIPPRREGARLGSWIVGIAAAVVLVLGLGLWWYTTQGPGAYTTVPPVAGWLQSEAEAVLTSAGLNVTVIEENSDEVAEGFAIRTDPAAQAQVPNGGDVTLVISAGPRMVVIPDLKGMTESEARAALAELDFDGAITTATTYHDTAPAGEVLLSDPAAGESLPHNTALTLTLSDGPEPVVMPDVTGQPEMQAFTSLIADHAFAVTTVYERTLDQPKGTVFKTDPAPGTTTTRTAAVTLYVSDGPPLVEVPDFTYNRVSQAQKTAQDLGLVVELRKANNYPWTTAEYVVDQSVAPGTQVEYGSTIILYYDS